MDPLYSSYYFALKNLWVLHRINNFGNSPDIPSGYSESLCKYLFNLEDTATRENDAQSSVGAIEIKATGTHEGKTTISKSNHFETLIWLFFDFGNDLVKTYKIPYGKFNLDGSEGRKSIRLLTIVNDNKIVPMEFKFKPQN